MNDPASEWQGAIFPLSLPLSFFFSLKATKGEASDHQKNGLSRKRQKRSCTAVVRQACNRFGITVEFRVPKDTESHRHVYYCCIGFLCNDHHNNDFLSCWGGSAKREAAPRWSLWSVGFLALRLVFCRDPSCFFGICSLVTHATASQGHKAQILPRLKKQSSLTKDSNNLN